MKNGIKVGNTALTQTAEELAVILVPSDTIDLPSTYHQVTTVSIAGILGFPNVFMVTDG